MYKMILIDDEKERIQSIKNFIDWKKYNIEVIGLAYNGNDGLALFENLLPDIAIVDIQMPYIDGLTIIEKIRTQNIKTEIIILSGYDNFDYAKKAIQWNVNNYLLKPCSIEEIIKAVTMARDKYIESEKRQKKIDQYYDLYAEHQKLNKIRFLENLLTNNLHHPLAIFEDIDKYNVQLLDSQSTVAVFRHIDKDNIFLNSHHISENELTDFFNSVKIPCVYEYIYHNGDLILFLSQEHPERDDFTQYAEQIKEELMEKFSITFAVGIGQPVASSVDIHLSYGQALDAIEHFSFFDDETLQTSILSYATSKVDKSLCFQYPFMDENNILKAIEIGDKDQCSRSFDHFYLKLQQDFQSEMNCFIGLTNTLIGSVYRHCLKNNIDVVNLTYIISDGYDAIAKARSINSVKSILYSLLMVIIDNTNSKSEENLFIQKALDYIHVHATENIGLQTLANELFITPAYFSHLFKQQMNINFVDYLNQYRIDLAKVLLTDVTLKNYEIAYKVGYQDEKYFYKLFKKLTGVTASQYRATIRF